MENSKTSILRILQLAGVVCAYLIGSGFASGQELLQYFASYGIAGIGAAIVAGIIMTYCVISFFKLGKSENISNAHEVFSYYCGKKLGSVFEFVAFTYLIVQVVVFMTGSGATIAQAFGVSPFIGSIIMGTVVILTVLLGLNRLVKIIGSLGVLLIILVVTIELIFLLRNPSAIGQGNVLVRTLDILQPSGSWFFAGFLYMTFNLLGLAAFMPLVGRDSNTQKENVIGGILGSVAFISTIILVNLSFLTDIGNVSQHLVPNLYIASSINPLLGSFFSILILLGVFTGCAPMFWNFCSRILPENHPRFKLFVLILGISAIILGAILPFDRAINIVYLVYGYVGTVFLAAIIYRQVISKIIDKRSCETEQIVNN